MSISKPTTGFRRVRVAVVIPAFNEAGRVGRVLEAIPRGSVDDIIVVDDHSTDGTVNESIKNGATYVTSCQSRGVGAAIKLGYSEALARGAEVLMVLAGDNQHDPHEIPQVLAPVLDGEADYVVGDRMSAYQKGNGMSPFRFVGNRILTMMTHLITGLDVKDSQCGYTAITSDALRSLDLKHITDSWGVPNDFLIECACHGLRVKYLHIKTRPGFRRSYISLYSYVPRMVFILLRGALRIAKARAGKGKIAQSRPMNAREKMLEEQIPIIQRHCWQSETSVALLTLVGLFWK